MKLAICLPDTQDDTPNVPIKLTRVGVTGVKKLLQLERTNKRPIIFFILSSYHKHYITIFITSLEYILASFVE